VIVIIYSDKSFEQLKE